MTDRGRSRALICNESTATVNSLDCTANVNSPSLSWCKYKSWVWKMWFTRILKRNWWMNSNRQEPNLAWKAEVQWHLPRNAVGRTKPRRTSRRKRGFSRLRVPNLKQIRTTALNNSEHIILKKWDKGSRKLEISVCSNWEILTRMQQTQEARTATTAHWRTSSEVHQLSSQPANEYKNP